MTTASMIFTPSIAIGVYSAIFKILVSLSLTKNPGVVTAPNFPEYFVLKLTLSLPIPRSDNTPLHATNPAVVTDKLVEIVMIPRSRVNTFISIMNS